MSRDGVEVAHEDGGRRGAFYILLDGLRAGELTYRHTGPGTITIDHTEVGESLRGLGAGKTMVEAAVAYARTQQLRIIPLCPFARALFDKRPDLRDVLAG